VASLVRSQVQFLVNYPEIGRSVLLFALLSAVGQLFIFYSLLLFDSLVCTTITTTRKFLTIVISVVFHGNVLSAAQWLAVAMVFGAVMYDAKPPSNRSKSRRKSDLDDAMLNTFSQCKPSSV
jgi:UDP-galactose transporter B1